MAEQLGLERSTDREDELKGTLREIFSGTDHLSIHNVVWKDIGSARLAIADLEQRPHHLQPHPSKCRASSGR